MSDSHANTFFSVLIAAHNAVDFIDDALDSLAMQGFTHWEAVVLDDGSKDGTWQRVNDRLRQAPDTRIRLYRNDRCLGVGATKARLVELAKGQLVAFLDADDALEPEALEAMVVSHAENPQAALVYSRYFECDAQLKVQKPCTQLPIPVGSSHLHHHSISHFAAFKLAFYRLTDGLNGSFKRAIDQDLYYKLEEVGEVVRLDACLYRYRQHAQNISLNDKVLLARFWHLVAKIDAHRRRREPIDHLEDYMLKVLRVAMAESDQSN